MTIEELAIQGKTQSHVGSAERSYDNIRKVRKTNIMRIFEQKAQRMNGEKLVTVNGIDYIDGSQINSINAWWLYMERSTKQLIWILPLVNMDKVRMNSILDTIKRKIKCIVFINNTTATNMTETEMLLRNTTHCENVETIEQAVELTKYITTEDENVIYMPIELDYDNISDQERRYKKVVYNL